VPDIRWEKEVATPALKSYLCRSIIYAMGLRFYRRNTSPSSSQHRWILMATDYFTKWIEAVPTRQATDTVIIQFLETNILSRFGCPVKIITDNAVVFKSKNMENFCNDYNITLGHSTTYYPQGNGLAESSNKSLTRIIKKLLQDNKKAWHKKLIYALWADRITTKNSISTSPFQIVYVRGGSFPHLVGIVQSGYCCKRKKLNLTMLRGG
jgi:transposase InsO family protein